MADNSAGSKVPGWVWLFTGTILGAFITFLVRLSDVEPSPADRRPARAESADAGTNKTPDKYDFYKMLKDAEVPVTAPKAPPGGQAAAKDEKMEYLLQVASFRSAAEAEQVRAELLLLNLSARIEKSANEGNTWHRVIVGPFANRSQLAKARNTLLSNRYDAMLLQRKRDG